MLNVVHIAASGFEGLFWVVVAVVAIIAQIAKSRGGQAPKPQGTSSGDGDPGEELRKFLESLGGGADQTPKPVSHQPAPPTPPPAPVRAPRPHAPRAPARARPPVARDGTAVRSSPRPILSNPPPSIPASFASGVVVAAPVHHDVSGSVGFGSLGMEIGDEMDSRKKELDLVAAHRAFRRRLIEDLRGRDRMSIPKAILLAQILGPPIGLRPGIQAPWEMR